MIKSIKAVRRNCIKFIDLITCSVTGDFKEAIDKLNSENLGVTIRYSIDETGNYNHGGDWYLESHDVNIKNI